MMSFRKIIEALELNIPFTYYKYNEEHQKSALLYLKVLSDEQKKEYEQLDEEEKKDFTTTTARVYIPRMMIYRYQNISHENGGYDFEYTINHIKKLLDVKKEEECLAVCLYMVLHEVGHWEDLKKKKFNVWDYAIVDSKESEEVFELKKKVEIEQDKEKRKKMAYEYLKRYNNTPIEKRANEYADEVFVESYYKLIDFYSDLK